MYLWAGERIYGQFRKTKPWFCAAEYAKSFFANFKIKIDTDNIEAPFTRRQLDRPEVSHGVTVALSAGFSRNSVSLSHNQQLQCFGFFFFRQANEPYMCKKGTYNKYKFDKV